ncbi:hypothetical protein GCM10023340_04140 [Nocardioides marinquilinus]|uniref:Lipoprotein LpqB beta-propeller domain-containing protein n=1 Tax=Nocardioides marinquilinus TaxID=1210400 RepID=A0ABP9PA88_9ACTN
MARAALTVLGGIAAAGCAATPPDLPRAAAEPVATDAAEPAVVLRDPAITESSGLALGVVHPDVVYTVNDRGGGPVVYAVGPDGETVATLQVGGARNVDWEDVAVTADGHVLVADIGDNDAERADVTLYTFPEPEVLDDQTVRTVASRFRYDTGPANAEAVLVDPRTDRLCVVTKAEDGEIHCADEPLTTSGGSGRAPQVLRLVAAAPGAVTSGGYSPDGSLYALRTTRRVLFFSAWDARPVVVDLPAQPQGESLAWTADGLSVLVGSEGATSSVLHVAVPDQLLEPEADR